MTVSPDNSVLSSRLPRARATDRVNILLVDDQPARLLSYETILGELGQNLICARSGVEALARLMKDEFALVLLDVSMPGMDGFETAAMIHEHPRFERTPIIFITGVHDSEFDRLKGYKLGAVDYVSIPVVPEILRSKVLVLVELHCQRLELQKLNRSLADANEQLEQANTTLQAEKNRELEALNQHLQKANTELAASNDALQAEIAERARAERRLEVQYAVSRMLADAPDAESAIPEVLRLIGEGLDWQWGALWTVDRQAGCLQCGTTWQAAHAPAPEL